MKTNPKRAKIQDVLRKNLKKFRLLYEKAPLSYHTLDKDGNLIAVNEAWLEMLGYTRKEVVGKSFADFLHPDRVELSKKKICALQEDRQDDGR